MRARGPNALAEAPGAAQTSPHVGDQRGVADAVHLEHGAEGDVLLVRGSRQVPVEARHLDAQRDPHARVVSRGDIGGPRAMVGHLLRFGRGEGPRARREARRGRAGQGVGDGVEEGAQQCLGRGEAQRTRSVQGCRVGLGRHSGGQFTDPRQVLGP